MPTRKEGWVKPPSINLAYCFAEDARVAIVDTDYQGSITDLKQFFVRVDIITLDQLTEPGTADRYDLAVIDTPPYLSNKLSALFARSDYVLVPTKAGLLDAMVIKATITLLRRSMAIKPTLKAGIGLNMVMPRTSLTDEVRELLLEYDTHLHTTTIAQRVSYTRSPMTRGVFGGDD